tara:strand:- start:3462 stop:4091 length:630 start_codon:yes stop_codon:yes gene_type:complete
MWALDSGGFTELNLHGKWQLPPQEYVQAVRRYIEEIGNLSWAATQDWMCEPTVLARTGLSVRDHQQQTVQSYLHLRDLAPEIPWSPAIQGWMGDDYERCVDLYAHHGVDLDAAPVVGVGSVCRRQNSAEAASIFRRLHARGLRLHGFGLKTRGLMLAAKYMASADSMAWSFAGRKQKKMKECTHKGSCANCLAHALRWRERVVSIPGVR